MSHVDDPVAIVGIGCRFPPDVVGPEAYWSFLLSGGDAVRDVPAGRWRWQAYYDDDPSKPAKMPIRKGAFLDQPIEDLDAAFFEVAPREAAQLDPQQRLLLEVSWEAFEDARLDPWSLRGGPAGVFVGAFTLDNMLQRTEPAAIEDIGPHTALTAAHTVLASRLSYFYDLRGPSFVVDTACSSSLVAVHEAVRALRAGDCEVALAGGVNRIFRPETMLMMAKGGFLAADGRSKSFSASADGYGRGEGCGLVVLRRLDDAERRGDRVYAVIEGTGINQDGRTGGPALPSSDAQARLIDRVVRQAAVDPGSVAYVEAHGTGTPVGDPAEARALGAVLGRAATRTRPCLVGSVKAGMGHLEGAAGVAGLIKAALVAHHGVVPPQAWLDELNPAIDFDGLGLHVATERTPLEAGSRPARVAVNSFGYGGTNAHAVLRPASAPGPGEGRRDASGGSWFAPVAVVSAHTEGALADLARDYAGLLRGAGSSAARHELLAAFAGRAAHQHRRVVVGAPAAFPERLDELASGRHHPDVVAGKAPGHRAAAPAFVLCGMGPQWWEMGRELLESHRGFREHAERCDEVFRPLAGWSIVAEMGAGERSSRMSRTAVAQPATFVLQSGLALVLAEAGVRPAAVVGHSVGEVAAAYLAGVLDLEDALTVAFHRSRLQATTAGEGAMLATDLGEAEARELIEPFEPAVSLAAVNAADATTIAGDPVDIERIRDKLTAQGRFCRQLRVEVAYHSPAMDGILDELRASLGGIRPRPPQVPLYSTVGEEFDGGGWDAAYWAANVRRPVAFEAAVSRLVRDDHRLFVELGPHPVLALYLHQITASVPRTAVVPTLHRELGDRQALTLCLARLWTHGGSVDWPAVAGGRPARSLPPYPWQREAHWQETDAVRRVRTGEPDHADVMHGREITPAPPTWDVDVSPSEVPWCRRHRVAGEAIFPAAGFVEMAVSHARRRNGGRLPVVLEDLQVQRPLVLPEHTDVVLRLVEGDHGQVTMWSRRRGESGRWREHATARIGRGHFAAPARPPDVDGGSLAEVDVDDLYARLAALGLDYQGPFRAMGRVRASRDRVVADLAAPGEVPGRYTTYPPLFDAAAFQVAFAAEERESSRLFVAVRIGRAVIHRDLPPRVVTHGASPRRSGDQVMFDVSLWAPDGSCVAELHDVELRAVAAPESGQAWLDQRTYELAWRADSGDSADSANGGAAGRQGRPRRWLVVDPGGDLGSALGDLGHAGADLVVDSCASVEAVAGDALREVDAVAVHLGAPGGGAAGAGGAGGAVEDTAGLLALVQRLAAAGRGVELVVVTRDAVAAAPGDGVRGWSSGWVAGFRRAVANELDGIVVRQVDHDGGDPRALRAAVLDSDGEEIALRRGVRLRPTLERRAASQRRDAWWATAPERPASEASNVSLVATGGTLDGLRWVTAERTPPGAGEVELRVEAVGLNYKDIAKVFGLLSAETMARTFVGANLGMEHCVTVERVGPGVRSYRVGQRFVAGLPTGITRYATLPAAELRMMPAHPDWTDVQCAGQLVALATAHMTIAEHGRVRAGEVVLVHGAAGGVGLAAVQVALARGARVFATAGTTDKRAFLRSVGVERTFDSRSLNFVTEARRATGGRGVDVVLNTLPGDGLRASLEVAADGGRVVDIGKREILDRGVLPLGLFDRNLTFVAFDLDQIALDADRFNQLGADVREHVRSGAYRAVPVTAYPAAAAPDAFELLARSGHTGKLVIDLGDARSLTCAEAPAPAGPVRPDRWYLVTGGTGGVGLEAARWLAGRGARRLVLTSRRGGLDDHGREVVAALRHDGVGVEVCAVDATDPSGVDGLLARRRRSGDALGGVVHCAGVTRDLPLVAMGPDDVRQVMLPKLAGAMVLDQATRTEPLDFFVLTSSVSALTGTSGQSAYAAANAALDAFAQWRRRQGRPAAAVALGPVAEVGMAARDDAIERYVRSQGFEPLPPARLGTCFDRALDWNHPNLAVFDVRWRDWALAEPRAAASGRFADIVAQAREGADGAGSAWVRIAPLPEDRRVEALAQLVGGSLAAVLGREDDPPGADDPLDGLGLDSLMLVDLQTRLNHELGAELSLMGLLDSQTVHDIARGLDRRLVSG